MKNPYYTPYVGNKRKEIKDILPLINLDSCNEFYNNVDMNIYEWIVDNKSLLLDSKNKIMFILQNTRTIKLLLKDFKVTFEYNKTYSLSNKKTTHIVYEN